MCRRAPTAVAVIVLAAAVAVQAAPVPKPPPGQFYLTCHDGVHVFTPDGKGKDPQPPLWTKSFHEKDAAVSPDGKWVAWDAQLVRPGGSGPDLAVFVRKLADKDGETRLCWRKYAHILGWVGDTVFYRGGDEYDQNKPDPLGAFVTASMKVFAYDTKTEKTAEFELPEDHLPEYLLPDGKAVLTETWAVKRKKPAGKLCRVTLADRKVTELCDLGQETFGGYEVPGAVSPDGRKLVGLWVKCEKFELAGRGELRPFGEAYDLRHGPEVDTPVFIDTTTGKRTELKLKHERGPLGTRWAWSPDGTKMAVVQSRERAERTDDPPNKPQTWDYVVTVLAADGTGAKKVTSVEAGWLVGFDWW